MTPTQRVTPEKRAEWKRLSENLVWDSKSMTVLGREAVPALLAELEQVEAERDAAHANNLKSICVYCGHLGPQDAEAMMVHAEQCEKHPVKALFAAQKELEACEAERDELRKGLQELCDASDATAPDKAWRDRMTSAWSDVRSALERARKT